ncbi:O-antigen ligase family protein [Planktomarina temperata]|nr:O-antigen ligase family protein [Planktomarina temperata]
MGLNSLNSDRIICILIFLSFFDRCAEFLYVAPSEAFYVLLFLLTTLGFHLTSIPKYNIFLLWLLIFLCLITVTALQLLYNLPVNFKYFTGQYLFRIGSVSYVIALLYKTNNFVNITRFSAYLCLAICLVGAGLIIIYGRIDFFRNVVYQGRPELAILKLTEAFNPNAISRYLLMMYPLAAYYLLKHVNKTYFLIGTCLIAIVLISAQSRIGLILFILTSVIFVGKFLKGTKLKYFIILGVSVLIIPTLTGRLVQKFDQYQLLETTARLEMYVGALAAIQEKPMLGFGAGNSAEVVHARSNLSQVYSEASNNKSADKLVVVHSSVLQAIVDFGLLTTALIYIPLLYLIFKNLRSNTDDFSFITALSVLMFILSGLTAANLGSNLGWVMVGLFSASLIRQRKKYD